MPKVFCPCGNLRGPGSKIGIHTVLVLHVYEPITKFHQNRHDASLTTFCWSWYLKSDFLLTGISSLLKRTFVFSSWIEVFQRGFRHFPWACVVWSVAQRSGTPHALSNTKIATWALRGRCWILTSLRDSAYALGWCCTLNLWCVRVCVIMEWCAVAHIRVAATTNGGYAKRKTHNITIYMQSCFSMGRLVAIHETEPRTNTEIDLSQFMKSSHGPILRLTCRNSWNRAMAQACFRVFRL